MSVDIDPEPDHRAAVDWLGAVRDAERRGELLLAVDIAERGLAEHPGDLWLAHRAVLCLARSGSTAEAERRFREFGLGEFSTRTSPPSEPASPRTRRCRQAARREGPGQPRPRTPTGRSSPAPAAITRRSTGDAHPDRRRERGRPRPCPRGAGVGRQRRRGFLLLGRDRGRGPAPSRCETAAGVALERAVAAADGDYGALATNRRHPAGGLRDQRRRPRDP